MRFLGIKSEALSFLVGLLFVGAVVGVVYSIATYQWCQNALFIAMGIPFLWIIGRAVRTAWRIHRRPLR